MKRNNNRYRFYRRIFFHSVFLLLLVCSGNIVFAQQDGQADTLISTDPDTDSLSRTETDRYYKDSVDQADHNFYDDLSYWPADSFQIRQIPDSIIKRLKSQDAFWYADKDFKKKYTAQEQSGFLDWLASQKWYRAIAWIVIIGGFAAVLIWFLASSNVRLFSRNAKTIAGNDEVPENIFEINYQEEINKAIRGGDYRLAVRLLFLRLLKNLAEKKAINYKEDATNFDYLIQLSSTSYYKDFFKVTRHYEYAWYGGFEVNEQLYSAIKKDFESLDTRLIKN